MGQGGLKRLEWMSELGALIDNTYIQTLMQINVSAYPATQPVKAYIEITDKISYSPTHSLQ